MELKKLTKTKYGIEIDDLQGTFDDLIKRLQDLKEWSKTLRNPETDKPDPNGIKYIGVGFGGCSGHGTALYYEEIESDEEYAERCKRLTKEKSKRRAQYEKLKKEFDENE